MVCDEPASGSAKMEPKQEASTTSSKAQTKQNQEQEKSLSTEEVNPRAKVPVESLVSKENASKERAAETAKPTPVAENKQEPVDAKTPATLEAESSAKRIFVRMYIAFIYIYILEMLGIDFSLYAHIFIPVMISKDPSHVGT